ncbi:hypothetical protein, partial [Phascolarctobacterium succinatutens]|uniref:hypothetical protein n=1 Tax=Phascolarctobacterium succinatutens TaxID=626940 RepID=UPI0040250FA1
YNFLMDHCKYSVVVVPRWFLVWYNQKGTPLYLREVVVPRWFLVWYNRPLQKALEAWLQGLFGMRKNNVNSIK